MFLRRLLIPMIGALLLLEACEEATVEVVTPHASNTPSPTQYASRRRDG